MNKLSYRQGDVYLVSTKKPKSVKKLKRDGPVILAHGEVTGHAHSISDDHAQLYDGSGVTYLEVKQAVALLQHQEHSSIEIAPGWYVVRRQREYSPEAIRRVAD